MDRHSGSLSGAFISLTEDELSFIITRIEEQGYKPDLSGIRKYLLESLGDENPPEMEGPSLAETMQDFIEGNPDTVNKVLQSAGVLTKSLLQKIVKKTTS